MTIPHPPAVITHKHPASPVPTKTNSQRLRTRKTRDCSPCDWALNGAVPSDRDRALLNRLELTDDVHCPRWRNSAWLPSPSLYQAFIAPYRAIHMRSSLALSRLRLTATLSPQGSLIQLLARRCDLPRPTGRISNCPPSLFVQHFSSRRFKDTPRQTRLGRTSNISLTRTNTPTSLTTRRLFTSPPQSLLEAATTGSILWTVILGLFAWWGVDEYLINSERSTTDAQRTLTQSD